MADFDDASPTLTATRPQKLDIRRAALTVVAGRDAGKRHEFDGRIRIGARPLSDFVVADPKVSGVHCELTVGADLRVRDLGSKNGTFVGAVRVIDAIVGPGDVLCIGDTRMQVAPLAERASVPLYEDDDFFGLVGQSAPMRALTARLSALAQSDTTVLVQGETGTGKERVAEALHLASRRAAGPQVVVDCGAMPATMIESELFGHERGAFTGAVASVPGAFERASGGTLFLDEVGELPLDLQPKLLRVLESRVVKRLGGTKTIPVDVRLVAATNRDLQLEAAAGRFREDLYYRLAVVVLAVPPLRERLDDLPLLVARLGQKLGVDPAPLLAPDALAQLGRHNWPGNVRELRNVVERVAVLAEPLSLSPRPGAAAPPTPAPARIDTSVPLRLGRRRVVDDFERAYVTQLLAECRGNVSEASRRAGLERMSLYRILHRLGLRQPNED